MAVPRIPPPEERLLVTSERRGEYVVVEIEGEIDNTTADLLREHAISVALSVASPQIVLDMDQVSFCDSSGLGAMVAIWKAVRVRCGVLMVARPPAICRRILERTGLDKRIPAFATLDRALNQPLQGALLPNMAHAAG
ncbi:STAS domain-containing protein [Actinomadura litoris]|uniref:STAS domain-containing protein n=1 Tax=Actinomadura litoris TaxID=2678616 RepID=UPI001FA77073|nr:STAS domain-containing protein [Actinomadura litoris]